MEYDILNWFQSIHNGFLDAVMVFFTNIGEYGIIWITLAIVCLCTKRYRQCGITIALALILSLIFCNAILKNVVARPRPFLSQETWTLLIKAPTDFSFPSGHTSASFAAAMSVFLYYKKEGIAALILAVCIAVSRLYLLVHFPSDVLASVLLGSMCAVISYIIIRYILRKLVKNNQTYDKI